MRKIDWTEPLGDDDIAFLRQMGVQTTEDVIRLHQESHGVEYYGPDDAPPDEVTRSAGDPSATMGDPTGSGPQVLIDPTQADPQGDAGDADEDYDKWKVPELEAEVAARNEMHNTTAVEVVGTGANGKVTKADLVKALRLWDSLNPDAVFPA